MDTEAPILLDIRQKLTWDYYINPKSPTFGKVVASAIRAGYTESYADNVGVTPWFQQKLRRLNLVSKAEKIFNKTLDMMTANDKGAEQADLLRVQTDVAKFIAKTLGKDEGYSERTELTGKDGEDIVFMPSELMNKYKLNENKPMENVIETPVEQEVTEETVVEAPVEETPSEPVEGGIPEATETAVEVAPEEEAAVLE